MRKSNFPEPSGHLRGCTPSPDNLRIGYDEAFDTAASSRAGGIAALLVLGAAVAVAAA